MQKGNINCYDNFLLGIFGCDGQKWRKKAFWLPDMCFGWLIVLIIGFKLKIDRGREEKERNGEMDFLNWLPNDRTLKTLNSGIFMRLFDAISSFAIYTIHTCETSVSSYSG